MVDSPKEIMNIQLGDVLEFIAPDSENLNQQQFYVKYVDTDKLKLININTQESLTLNIEDNKFVDKSILSVELLSRAEFPGYARQNDLVPGVWIDIYFEGEDELPFIITGQIINLEEDTIELKTYPDDDSIYIDFAYKGIPEDLPIEKIVIRQEPTPKLSESSLPDDNAIGLSDSQILETSLLDLNIPEPDVKDLLEEALLEGSQIIFGEYLDDVVQFVDVPEAEKRYSIEKQTDNLLDELLANIPNYKRTPAALNNIHTMIERYVQLRSIYSSFDKNGTANQPLPLNENIKPIIKELTQFKTKFSWLLPVSQNRKKLYDLDDSIKNELGTTTIVPLNLAQQLIAEQNDIEQYQNGRGPSDENKYVQLFRNLNKFVTPFVPPFNLEESITSQNVNANILSVVDNLGELESIVAAHEAGNVEKRHFLFETYTTGLTYLKDKTIQKLTPSDIITIRSILTLSIPAVLFSRIDLPTTNILKRSELDKLHFAYWEILNKNTNIQQQLTIDTLDIKTTKDLPSQEPESGYDSDPDTDRVAHFRKTFFSGIREYILDENLFEAGTTANDTYERFLNMIIPTNEEIFDILKKYLSNTVSSYSVIKFLEVFNIYHRDITFNLYKKINMFIELNISNYINTFAANYRTYQKLATRKEPPKTLNKWLQLLSKHTALNTIVLNAYGFNKEHNYSNSEIFTRIMYVDYGRLFTIALIRIDLDLQSAGLIEEFIKKYEQSLREKQQEPNNCKIIAKKYLSLDKLEGDNAINSVQPLFFDPEYDKTDYSFLEKYKIKKTDFSNDELKDLLQTKLVEEKKLVPIDAIREANAILLNKKIVADGDYAILILPKESETDESSAAYYVRTNNSWVKVDNIVGDVVINDNKLFCNLQEECISNNNNCDSLAITEHNINDETLKAIYKEFDSTYGDKEDDLRQKIDQILESSIIRIRYLKRLKELDFFKYDKLKRELGKTIVDDEPGDILVESQYEKLRDIILGQPDFIKKQNDIQRFVLLFTRQPLITEDQYWLYCIKTGVKLLPTFLSHLANTYISGGDYLYELDVIATDQGTISDDGDAFVDKYSGYFIKKIAFDTEEGFTEEGFKLKTREKLELDLGDAILQQAKDDTKNPVETDQEKTISNIINAITGSGGMGIDLISDKTFIIRNVLSLYERVIPTRQQFDRNVKKLQKEGKKIPSFDDEIGRPLILLTFTFILIAIQISIPSINVRKTFPGCIKSFIGYPVFGDDLSPVIYLACIARKIRSSAFPWNSIKHLKEEQLVNLIKKVILNHKILDIPLVKERIKEKIIYRKTERYDIKIDETHKEKLHGFFPPLIPYTITPLPLIAGFGELLLKNIKSGNSRQQEQILTIHSKIIAFGLSIQEKIQKIIYKKVPLITNNAAVPFLENACCDDISPDVHKYFIDIDSSIITDNAIATNLDNMLYDIYNLSRAPLFYDPTDTRYKSTEVTPYFSQDTIYRAFIVFCKSKELALSEELRTVCGIDSSDPFITETTEQRIEQLKEDGINYDEKLLQQLLNLVNLKNSLNLDLTIKVPNSIQILTEILTEIKDNTQSQVVPIAFVENFLTLLDRYSIKQEQATSVELRKFKNYLASQTDILSDKIKKFIMLNNSISKSKLKRFIDCFDNINIFLESGDNVYVSAKDETVYKMMFFIRNAIQNIVNIFPNIVLNKVDYTDIIIPKHWKLSQRHNLDIKNIISSYYTNLKQFYGVNDLDSILKNIQNKCQQIKALAINTPFFASFFNGQTEIGSIFDERLVSLLFKYYILLILDTYISLVNSAEIAATSVAVFPIGEQGEPEEPEEPEEEEQEESFVAAATIAGEKKEVANKLSNYLVVIVEILCGDKDAINFNKEIIMSKILSAKEKEKTDITDYLKNLEDDERAVENVFKHHKLEKWSKGLQKGLTQYVQENYDEERELLEQEQIKDRQLAKNPGVTESNKDIYANDFDADAAVSNEIESEVYSLVDFPGEDEDDPAYGNNPEDYEDY